MNYTWNYMRITVHRDVFQLHHGHGGEQRAADRAGSQLSPQTPGHTQHAHLGEN